jgi:hypothetical protein
METKELEITDFNDGSDSKPLSKYMPKVLGRAWDRVKERKAEEEALTLAVKGVQSHASSGKIIQE